MEKAHGTRKVDSRIKLGKKVTVTLESFGIVTTIVGTIAHKGKDLVLLHDVTVTRSNGDVEEWVSYSVPKHYINTIEESEKVKETIRIDKDKITFNCPSEEKLEKVVECDNKGTKCEECWRKAFASKLREKQEVFSTMILNFIQLDVFKELIIETTTEDSLIFTAKINGRQYYFEYPTGYEGNIAKDLYKSIAEVL